jgi:hypothetical protein
MEVPPKIEAVGDIDINAGSPSFVFVLETDAGVEQTQQLIAHTLPFDARSLVVAGVTDIVKEASEMGGELDAALPCFDNAGDDVSQHKTRERSVGNADNAAVIASSRRGYPWL